MTRKTCPKCRRPLVEVHTRSGAVVLGCLGFRQRSPDGKPKCRFLLRLRIAEQLRRKGVRPLGGFE